MKCHNEQYARSRWSSQADKTLLQPADLGPPRILADCVHRQDPPTGGRSRTRQRGPADAVERPSKEPCASEATGEASSSEEEMEFNAAVADRDLHLVGF